MAEQSKAPQATTEAARGGVHSAEGVSQRIAGDSADTAQDVLRAGSRVAETLLSQSQDMVDAGARLNAIALKGFQSMTHVWTDFLSDHMVRAVPKQGEAAEPAGSAAQNSVTPNSITAVRRLFETSATMAQISSDCLREAATLVRETGQRSGARTREMIGG